MEFPLKLRLGPPIFFAMDKIAVKSGRLPFLAKYGSKICPFWDPRGPETAIKMSKNGSSLTIFDQNDVYMVYFAEKISSTKFGNIWSRLQLSQVEIFCHFSIHAPPKWP